MILIWSSILTLLIALSIPGWIKQIRLWHWQQTLNLNQHRAIFQKLYNNVNGFALSLKARQTNDAFEYTYGEIEFAPYIALIAMAKPTTHTRFYDLGCGTGKAVLSCAMVFDMQHYCGIELFRELHQQADIQKNRLQKTINYTDRAKKITFIHDDFLNVDLNDATLIFINATALIGPIWEQLNNKLSKIATGVTVITTTKQLRSSSFLVTKVTNVEMSWGITSAYIHISI